MINYRLLTGILAFVLVAGIATPSFAQSMATETSESSEVFTPQHGPVDQSFTGPFVGGLFIGPSNPNTGQTFTPATSFLIGVDFFTWDFSRAGLHTFTVTIWDGSAPGTGNLLGTVTRTVDLTGSTFGNQKVIHTNFVPSIAVIPGNTYSIGLDSINVQSLASASNVNPYAGGIAHQNNNAFPNLDFGFVTYFSDVYVGGDMLSIDSTALVLAGLQSNAIWMLPVLAVAAGTGAFYIKTRMNKE